jgi:DNA-binding NtrC family response regulator
VSDVDVKSGEPSLQNDLGILGESLEMKKIVEVIRQVGPTDITVLISGESGVGKEVVAKAIFTTSLRSKKPFITVNSGAIPEGILESELFGHEKGSFTGATEQRKGYFELADGGTIFLDEIGELPLASQVRFLRILESGEFLRVGSSITRKVNVRVIAATNKDLENEVRNNQFRADLFYRLRSVNIHIPPLRKRPEDVEVFFRHFVAEFTARSNTRFGGITDEALQVLRTYHWPGNVRELRNVVESMLVLERGKKIDAYDVRKYLKGYRDVQEDRNLPVPLGRSVEQAERELILRALLDIKGNILDLKNLMSAHAGNGSGMNGGAMALRDPQEEMNLSLQEMEKRMINEALHRFKNNRRVAARALNISERTLYRKIKEYGLE